MKKALFSIISIVFVLSVILITFSFNTLETVRDGNFIQYKVNKIEFDTIVAGGVLEGDKIRFERGDYVFESVEPVENFYLHIGMKQFRRYRKNVYSDSGVEFNGYVPIYIDTIVNRYTEAPNGKVYEVKIEHYYIDFTFEQFSRNATYVLEYQEYMNENEPSLQRPPKPNYEVENISDIFELVSNFFKYVGDSFEYFFQRLEYYGNYIKFYIQDWALLFSFD